MGLWNVFPSLATDDVAYGVTRDPICPSNSSRIATTTGLCSYVGNIVVGNFGSAISLAARLPILGLSIFHILQLGAEKKMVRIYAGGIIATMKNALPFRYFSVGKNIRGSMGKHIVLPKFEAAISTLGSYTCLPIPAFIRAFFINLIPKQIYCVPCFWFHVVTEKFGNYLYAFISRVCVALIVNNLCHLFECSHWTSYIPMPTNSITSVTVVSI